MNTFYKIRKVGTKLFYSPPCYRHQGRFDKSGKRYTILSAALRRAEENKALSVRCEVVKYIEEILEIGTISSTNKLTLALNQTAT